MIKKINKFLNLHKDTNENEILTKIDNLYNSLDTESIQIEIGNDIVKFNETIRNCIDKFRTNTKEKYGFIFPAVRIRDKQSLQTNEVVIKINNKTAIEQFLIPTAEKVEQEFNEGLNKLFNDYIEDIFSCEIMERYILLVRNKNAYLIWNLTNTYSVVELKNILVFLLKNKKSLNNISYIMEQIGQICLSNGCPYYKEPQKVATELLKIL